MSHTNRGSEMGLFFLFWLQKDIFQSYPIIVRKKFCIEKLRLERQILSLTNFYFGFLRRNNIFIIYKLRDWRRYSFMVLVATKLWFCYFFHIIKCFYFFILLLSSLASHLFCKTIESFFQSDPIIHRKIFCSKNCAIVC